MVAATNVGIPSKPTPTGHFRIEHKIADKRSGTYGFWVKGDQAVAGESSHCTLPGGHYVGYPMGFWCEFEPEYGFHQGYVWPIARTHGCLRLHHNVAPKFYSLVRIGTPVDIERTQPEDETLGAHIDHPTDYNDPDPPATFMASSKVFEMPPGGGLVPY
jgi:lipoprotein-anchoring transpeptidase ErfK/SrfK